MGLLVDQLLNLARVGRHAVNREATKLNSIVAEVVRDSAAGERRTASGMGDRRSARYAV